MNELLNRLITDIENSHHILKCLPLRQEYGPYDEADPMDTLGNLVDKLVTVNLKMWHNQENLYEIRRMTEKDFRDKWGADLGGLRDVIGRCCDLNVQRSKLMDEIDKFFRDAISGKVEHDGLVREQHKTY